MAWKSRTDEIDVGQVIWVDGSCVFKIQFSFRLVDGVVRPVSYTHLDVYKRQLHDSADKQFYIIGGDGFVVGRGVIVPKVLAFFGKAISRFQRDAGLSLIHI